MALSGQRADTSGARADRRPDQDGYFDSASGKPLTAAGSNK
jgi:hypothetical protein